MAARSTPQPSSKSRPSEPPKSRQQSTRRLLGLAAIATVLLGLGWLTGSLAAIPLQMCQRSLDKQREDQAEAYIGWAEWLNANRARTELLRARIERRRSNFDRMSQHLQRAASAGASRRQIEHEELLAAAQTGQLQEIEPRIKAWLADPGEDAIEICQAYSNGLTMLGRLPDAEVILKAWKADRPDDPEPSFREGRIQEHLLNYEEAEKSYRAALQKNPKYPSALFALGRLLLDRKRAAEALEQFRSCEQYAPATGPAAQAGIAMCLRSLGRIEEARQMLQQLVQVDQAARDKAYFLVRYLPQSDPATLELGKLESDEGNFDTAEKWLRQTVESNPRDLDARYAWAVALRGSGKPADSQREFEYVSRVRKILAETDRLYDKLGEKPDDVEARYQLGLAYLQYRSEQEGLYWLQSVLNYDPHHSPTHQTLADYYREHSDESPAYRNLAEYHQQQVKTPQQDVRSE